MCSRGWRSLCPATGLVYEIHIISIIFIIIGVIIIINIITPIVAENDPHSSVAGRQAGCKAPQGYLHCKDEECRHCPRFKGSWQSFAISSEPRISAGSVRGEIPEWMKTQKRSPVPEGRRAATEICYGFLALSEFQPDGAQGQLRGSSFRDEPRTTKLPTFFGQRRSTEKATLQSGTLLSINLHLISCSLRSPGRSSDRLTY